MCYYCHTLGKNVDAPDHRSQNCRDRSNTHSKYYQADGEPEGRTTKGCYYCHTLGKNVAAPPHRSRNCRDRSNPHSKYYQDTGNTVIGYHATNSDAANGIATCGFRCGTAGMAGGAIYFATSEEDARRKSNNGNTVVFRCLLRMDRVCELDCNGDASMTLQSLNAKGYDSVKIRRNGDEYVVYEPWRVRILSRSDA